MRGPLDKRRQPGQGSHKSQITLASRCLEFVRCSNASNVGFSGDARGEEDTHTVTTMMGTNDVSKGESRKMMMLSEKVSCLLQDARIYLHPTILTSCRMPHKMMQVANGLSMDRRVRHINGMVYKI